MNKRILKRGFGAYLLAIAATLGLMATSANAAVISLFDYAFNIDGIVTEPFLGDPIPGNVDLSAFDDLTGLGTLTMTVTGVGAHNTLLFVDHEIDEATNTFFNEEVSFIGALSPGQNAEADEPGFGSLQNGSGGVQYFGDIFDNLVAGSFDNFMFWDAFDGQSLTPPDDMSMGIGWNFNLLAGETGIASFFVSETNDSGGLFTFNQIDPDSDAEIFFWSSLDISGGGTPVPEPGTLWLLGAGLLGLGLSRRRKLGKI